VLSLYLIRFAGSNGDTSDRLLSLLQ